MKRLILMLIPTLSWIPTAARASVPARPPQYVMFAFDGSYDSDRWQNTREFAAVLTTQQKIDFHFTYFISSVYFLESAKKASYQGPHHHPGQSDIGFGGSPQEIDARIQQLHLTQHDGHEMGSHLCGHFDGSGWSAADWTQEFKTFGAMTSSFVDLKEIVGFRAPYLGTSPGLFSTLKDFHFRYDTSLTSAPTYWPEKKNGVWNFPLAELTIAGTAKRTLSMDYNFFVSQSQAKEDPANSKTYEAQMYQTYLKYFATNYSGNRAPVHIGHHFGLWNGGAYWHALQHFAREVCAKPEVKCVTYKEYADYLDGLDADTLASYRKGGFEHGGMPKSEMILARTWDISLQLAQNADGTVSATLGGRDASAPGLTLRWELDGKSVPITTTGAPLSLKSLPWVPGSQLSAVAALNGVEIQRATHGISSDLQLSADSLESRSLQGDLPEAHF